jgi:hypothetical protein
MMSDADYYREKADQVERLARLQTLQSERDDLLLLAAEWRALADAIQRRLQFQAGG